MVVNETVHENKLPNIAEEEGVPPMIDDSPNEASASTIEQQNEQGGGREVNPVVAAPTNEVINSADEENVPAFDPSPGKKKCGRSKTKGVLGSQNEPVKTTSEKDVPNIAEEDGFPPMIDDSPTEATASLIEQHNVGAELQLLEEVIPMSELPHSDKGGVNPPTNATEPSDATALKQLRTTPDKHSTWTEEKLLSVCDYAFPFTVYQHCLPGNEWMKDAPISTPCSIFPVTGARRKNEVKDNFDWLLPRTKSADIKDTVMAYESSYHFGTGFSSLDRMVSNKICATPQSVENRCVAFYDIHHCVLNHPLCNIEQKADWLAKSVGNLINRMNSASKRPPTRGSVQDSRLGHDIFLCSTYVPADEFVSITDDVELVDFVAKDSSKKIWHCYDLVQVLAAYSEAIDNDNFPDWYSSLLTADPTKPNASGMVKQIWFLGLVSLFNSKCGSKVNAFRMHCFLLYSFTPETNST